MGCVCWVVVVGGVDCARCGLFFAVFVCFVDACGWFALIIDFVCLLVIGFGGFCCVWVCLLVCLIALPVGLLVGYSVCCVSL